MLSLNNTDSSGWSGNANVTAFNLVRTQVLADINNYFNINAAIAYDWDFGSTAGFGSPAAHTDNISSISAVNYTTLHNTLTGLTSDALKAIAYNSTNLPTTEAGLTGTPPFSGTVYSYTLGLNAILTSGTLVRNALAPLGTIFSNAVTWSTDQHGATTAGQLSLYGVMWHELTEALGRVTQLGSSQIGPLDLFVFTANNLRCWTHNTSSRYFSYHNGASNDSSLDVLGNAGFFNSSLGDWGGWGATTNTTTFNSSTYVSPFNENTNTIQNGQSGAPLPGDIRLLAAIGWPLSAAGETFAGLTGQYIPPPAGSGTTKGLWPSMYHV